LKHPVADSFAGLQQRQQVDRRIWRNALTDPFRRHSPNFINALLSAEDDNFANHYGVDPSSLMRAATQLVKSGHIQSGGSTITMQVAKNFFLTSERSFSRKTTEILLALQIERS
jgi:membrane carboxypeptidase/penicillin-binding protein